MTSRKFVFYLTCLFLGEMAQATGPSSSLRQDRRFVSAHVGGKLNLGCFHKGNMVAKYYWYKQSVGQKPRLISTFYMFDKNGTFYGDFKSNSRFTLSTNNGETQLDISDLRLSDSATYYCASSFLQTFEFAESITVSVRGSGLSIPALVQQPGGSETLNCTVQTGSHDGEQHIYWFKTSEESHPGLIYTHGGRTDQSERESNTQTHTCVYKMPKKSNVAHAETFDCAVVSCAHVLFGDGTKLDFEDDGDSFVLVHFLIGALAFTSTPSLVLAFLLCILSKRSSCVCGEPHVRFSAASTANAEGQVNEDNLHYAAIRINKARRSRRQRDDTGGECVYSSVMH